MGLLEQIDMELQKDLLNFLSSRKKSHIRIGLEMHYLPRF